MAEKKYTKEHEWVEVDGDTATVGITNHAQESLGDIVFIDLPTVGKEVKSNEELCVIESVKAASDVYSPISGEVTEVNSILEDQPEIINSSPYEDGWFFKMAPSDLGEIEDLLSPEDYSEVCED